ncbi:hypothetical protein SDC9_155421 [bioreactor metagenome]|uniref:Uncharacterized protein n=1 Tax=bioreactor metagenome TaxID=1076179 RepID=A0A645F6P1_9ZZZZ
MIHAENFNFTGILFEQVHHEFYSSRFTGPVWPDKSHDISFFHDDIYTLEAEILKILSKSSYFQNRCHSSILLIQQF